MRKIAQLVRGGPRIHIHQCGSRFPVLILDHKVGHLLEYLSDSGGCISCLLPLSLSEPHSSAIKGG